jgi:hypothetical protein
LRKSILAVLFILSIQTAFAQKSVQERGQFWIAYFNQTRLTNKFGIWLDIHARSIDLNSAKTQYFIRPGLIYYLTDQVRLMGGYAYTYNADFTTAIPTLMNTAHGSKFGSDRNMMVSRRYNILDLNNDF